MRAWQASGDATGAQMMNAAPKTTPFSANTKASSG
jgi:hypothetical protein